MVSSPIIFWNSLTLYQELHRRKHHRISIRKLQHRLYRQYSRNFWEWNVPGMLKTWRGSVSWQGPGIRAHLSFGKGGVASAPATIINGVAALGCGAQYRRLLAVRRTSIVPPCNPPPPSQPPSHCSRSFSLSPSVLSPTTPSFADIDDPPCALPPSA